MSICLPTLTAILLPIGLPFVLLFKSFYFIFLDYFNKNEKHVINLIAGIILFLVFLVVVFRLIQKRKKIKYFKDFLKVGSEVLGDKTALYLLTALILTVIIGCNFWAFTGILSTLFAASN